VRVLVTGGAGFIGSYLVDRHLAAGDSVVVIDDFSTGSHDNLAHHDTSSLTVVEGRVEDPGVLDRAFVDIDLVYHLAAAVGVFTILRRPLECLRTNLDATEAVFERATREGVRTVFTSTSEVYGKNGKSNLRETDDSIYGPTTAARWLYAVSKATDEFLALANHREYGFPVTIVRLFNTTGPRQTGAYGMVVPRLIRQALAGEPLTVFGEGTQTRSFTNVHDTVEALTRIGRTPEAIGQVVNIGRPDEITILDLAERIIEVTGSASKVELVPYAVAYEPGFEDMRRRVPDVTLLNELIGWVPQTPIETTIRQIVESMDAELVPTVAAAPSAS
jgi:UDP-glucose 4-epimerase